jgi:hypothetical protein
VYVHTPSMKRSPVSRDTCSSVPLWLNSNGARFLSSFYSRSPVGELVAGASVDSRGRWHHLFGGSLTAAKERAVLTAR